MEEFETLDEIKESLFKEKYLNKEKNDDEEKITGTGL